MTVNWESLTEAKADLAEQGRVVLWGVDNNLYAPKVNSIRIVTDGPDEPTFEQRIRYNTEWLDENSRKLEALRAGIEHISRTYNSAY